ncbi:MAG: hypothetical protein ACR2JD_03865 [Nocardioides sp.]
MGTRLDLADGAVRARVTARLAGVYAGRPVIMAAGTLSGATGIARWLCGIGCRVLVVCTARGNGEIPAPGEAEVVEIPAPSAASVTQELRTHDRLFRTLPAHALAAIEAFDPERRAVWWASPFVTSDALIAGRPVTGGRPAAFMALEDKLLAEGIWRTAGVKAAPHRVVPVDRAALAVATEEVAGRLGVVWSGDARDGFNGGGDFVRWVTGEATQAAAFAFFSLRCDQVRVMPFLDGVPCSIHAMVLADGTAAFRPVEISTLRDPVRHRFVYGGVSTFWDPPAADREEMRAAVRRVGEHLRAAYSYRGGFGIDGVLTAEGFRPTELNSRLTSGFTTAGDVDRPFLSLLQVHLLAGRDPGISVADLETLVSLLDAHRRGRPTALMARLHIGEAHEFPVRWDGRALHHSPVPTGDVVAVSDTPTGSLAAIVPCSFLGVGDRLAVLDLALKNLLDREYAAGFGPLVAP